jgi:hypothetical protein
MNLVMLAGVIYSRGAILLPLILYLDCNQCGQHGLKNHFGHVTVDIHSFLSVSTLVVNMSYECSDVGLSN